MSEKSSGQAAVSLENVPSHIAIIMDGNGRWAEARGLSRSDGHRAGVKAVRSVVEECRRLGVRYLTLFSFSSENWQRPRAEVSTLMSLFKQSLECELENMLENDIRLRVVGELSRLPQIVQKTMARVVARTASATGMDLILALSYGGREEIVGAARRIAERVERGELNVDQIDEELFASLLYAPDVPDPDVVIRTSGECRISNFLLWQLAYAEVIVSPVFWPDFSAEELQRCISEFAGRERRYGKTSAQMRKAG